MTGVFFIVSALPHRLLVGRCTQLSAGRQKGKDHLVPEMGLPSLGALTQDGFHVGSTGAVEPSSQLDTPFPIRCSVQFFSSTCIYPSLSISTEPYKRPFYWFPPTGVIFLPLAFTSLRNIFLFVYSFTGFQHLICQVKN